MSPHSAPELPRSVADFIAARNRRDYDAAIAAFAPNATVSDEGGMHRGRAAIRAWMEGTVRQYDDTAAVIAVAGDGEARLVTARVTGSFPGSPAVLRFDFILGAEGIDRLEIGA